MDLAGAVDLSEGTDQGPASCIELSVGFEVLTATVVILVDRSASMNADFGNGQRWGVLRDALIDPNIGIVPRYDDQVEFGLTMYTSIDGYQGGQPCPLLVGVESGPNNFGAIQGAYAMVGNPAGPSDTPTAESIRAVTQQLERVNKPGPRVIILATDGNPDTCADPDDHSRGSQILSESAVEDAFKRGIETFVISVGDEVTQAHLQNLANLGAGAPLTAKEPYYQANDPDSLLNAFSTIVGSVLPCEFELEGSIDVEDAPQGNVTLDQTPLTYGQQWDLPEENIVRLLGDSCTEFQAGGHQVDVSFPCGFSIR